MAYKWNEEKYKEYEKIKKQRVTPDQIKLLKYSIRSKASIALSNDSVSMQSDDYEITIGDNYGIMIDGPIGYSQFWHKMKYGGVYRGNPMVHSNLPSTINTPIPLFIWDFPYENIKALYMNPIIEGLKGLL